MAPDRNWPARAQRGRARSSVTRFAVVLLTESTVRALSAQLLRHSLDERVPLIVAPRARRDGGQGPMGCWSANLPTGG